jgi:glucose/arabinose dehydrogenase
MRRGLAGLAVVAVVAGFSPALAADPAAASGFAAGLSDTVVAGGLGAPTAVATLPDGRFLVTSQEGRLWVVGSGSAATVALDLAASGKVCSDAEEGLLGVTVDPLFATNGGIYLYYTARIGSCALTGANAGGAKNRVSRFTMSGSTVNAATELVLLDNMPEWGGNHNGGDVRVANDGTMFVSVGDGGAGSPAANAADLSLPNGKILRINRDGTIPADNPHGTAACRGSWGPPGAVKVCGEIWADGLRNPFRLGFDAAAPGAKFRINDVGDQTWEEVDDAVAGAHYGWPCREGPDPHASSAACTAPMTGPVLFYHHSTGCNVESGGAFVPPETWGELAGSYLWVDFGCGQLFLARPGETGTPPATLATGMSLTTDLEFFQVGGTYSLFYTTYANGGQLHRVLGSPAPTSRFAPLGGRGLVSSGPAAASWSAGRLDVFVKGVDGQLWHKWFDGGWSGWEALGGGLDGAPAAASWSAGRLDVFVKGVDGQLWHKWFDGGWNP